MTIESLTIVLVLLLQAAPPAPANPFSPWVLEGQGGRAIEAADGVITVRSEGLWLRSPSQHSDFTMTGEFRLTTPESVASILVRTKTSRHATTPRYRILISGRTDGRQALGRVQATGSRVSEQRSAATLRPLDAGVWHRLEIQCLEERVGVQVNGTLIAIVGGLSQPAGYVGIEGGQGAVQFRDLKITDAFTWEYGDYGDALPEGVYRLPAEGVAPPRVVRQVAPQYTTDTFAGRVEGTVIIKGIVSLEGRLEHIRVSSAPHPDLDEDMVALVRRWRFKPAVKDGVAVPVLVTLQMRFTLR